MALEYRTLLHDQQSGPASAATKLVTTAEGLLDLGLRGELPSQAFDALPVAMIALGQQPTLAHSVEVTGVSEGASADEAVIHYRHRTDGPPADALSFPVQLIALPVTVRRCRFEKAA